MGELDNVSSFGSLVCNKVRSNFRCRGNEQLAETSEKLVGTSCRVACCSDFPAWVVRINLVTLKGGIISPRLYNRRSEVIYLDWSSFVLHLEKLKREICSVRTHVNHDVKNIASVPRLRGSENNRSNTIEWDQRQVLAPNHRCRIIAALLFLNYWWWFIWVLFSDSSSSHE